MTAFIVFITIAALVAFSKKKIEVFSFYGAVEQSGGYKNPRVSTQLRNVTFVKNDGSKLFFKTLIGKHNLADSIFENFRNIPSGTFCLITLTPPLWCRNWAHTTGLLYAYKASGGDIVAFDEDYRHAAIDAYTGALGSRFFYGGMGLNPLGLRYLVSSIGGFIPLLMLAFPFLYFMSKESRDVEFVLVVASMAILVVPFILHHTLGLAAKWRLYRQCKEIAESAGIVTPLH